MLSNFSDNELIRKKVIDEVIHPKSSLPFDYSTFWSSTMDVSIRAANYFVVGLLLNQYSPEAKFSGFETEFLKELRLHLKHILLNLESKGGLGNNHYLANIVGILYTAYVFSDRFAVRKANKFSRILLKEIDKQFLDDGMNFESSTTYHAFSLEIGLYGLALIDRMLLDDRYKIQLCTEELEKARVKLFKAYRLLESIVQGGSIVQFGDNDSARFFKPELDFELVTLEELSKRYSRIEGDKDTVVANFNLLDYNPVLEAARTYFGVGLSNNTPSSTLIHSIMGRNGNKPEIQRMDFKLPKSSAEIDLPYKNRTFIRIDSIDKVNDFTSTVYPIGGLYILHSERVMIFINGMNRQVKQYWPHGHNDKLSFELNINETALFRDPGSYTYTGDWKLRNKYRSVKAHNAPQHGLEQNRWLDGKGGVFRMIPDSHVELIESSDNSITLKLTFRNIVHIRQWLVDGKGLWIKDRSNHPFDTNYYPEIFFSDGYGKMTRSYA